MAFVASGWTTSDSCPGHVATSARCHLQPGRAMLLVATTWPRHESDVVRNTCIYMHVLRTTSDSCLGHVVATRSIALPGCNTCSPARADIWSEKKPTRNAEWLSETNQKRVWKIGHDQIWWLIVIFPIEVTMLGASPIFGQSPNDFPKAQRMLPWLFDAMGIVGPPWTLRTLRAFQQWNGCSVHGHEKAGKKHGFTISICTCVLKHVGNRKQSLSSAVPACLLIVVVGLPLLSVVDNPRALHRSHLAPSVPCPSASAAASWPVVALPSAASPAGFQQHFEFGLAKNLKRQLK